MNSLSTIQPHINININIPINYTTTASTRTDEEVRRFGGTARLLGDTGLTRLQKTHVVVIGIGGVGSWAAECLARSGVGQLTLIDLDVIAPSNVNRQIHAQDTTFGMDKVHVMAQRINSYAPACQVNTVDDWITPDNVASLVPLDACVVLDCIDQVLAKTALAVICQARGQALIVCGAAGGKTDLSQLQIADLAHVSHDPLLASLRTRLRKQHGFAPAPERQKEGIKRMGICCVYVAQSVAKPISTPKLSRLTNEAICELTAPQGLNCAGYGSMMHMTASMGLRAASWALEHITNHPSNDQ
jgi:tRNA threonylcarbamoyladenosine dehydratase